MKKEISKIVIIKLSDDIPIVPPPANITIQHDYKAILYLPNGKVLVRKAGF